MTGLLEQLRAKKMYKTDRIDSIQALGKAGSHGKIFK